MNAMSNRRLLRKLTHPSQQSLDHLRKAIEDWEADLREYVDRGGKDLEDDQKSLSIQDMCPDVLREHIELQAARLNKYALIRKEVDSYLESRNAREMGGAAPMDVGSLGKRGGKSKNGKGDTPKG